MDTDGFPIQGDSLTLGVVGFYAGLNLLAWFLIFCFVRETKRLTLEELDRKLILGSSVWVDANVSRRGLLSPDEEVH